MNKDAIITTLQEHAPQLRAMGILHAALFGSRARGDNRPDSDIDILIDTDPAARITIYDYVGLKENIAQLFSLPVDVIRKKNLKPYLRSKVDSDAIYAF